MATESCPHCRSKWQYRHFPGEWKEDREEGKVFKGGLEEKLDREMKNRLHKKRGVEKKERLFSGSNEWKTFDACATVHLPWWWKGWTAALQDLPPQLTPTALIIHNPFPSTTTKKCELLRGSKPLDDLYMCEPVGVALCDKDGSTEWVKSTQWYSFCFSMVILLMETGKVQSLWALTFCIDQRLLVECWHLNGSSMSTVGCSLNVHVQKYSSV